MMKQFKLNKWILLAIPALALTVNASAQPTSQHIKNGAATQNKAGTQTQNTRPGQQVEGIAAIVNTEIITQKELSDRLEANRISQTDSVSREKVLAEMVDEKLVEDDAARLGVQITNAQVNHAVESIANRNGMNLEQFREAAKKYKIDWDVYVDNIYRQILMEELRGQILRNRVNVTEADIDAYLKQNPTGVSPDYKPEVRQGRQPPAQKRIVVERSFEPKAIAFQHIYIRVADGASEELEQEAREEANEALRKIRGGESFESVAKRYSDAPEASNGGNLGIRLFSDWPKLFVAVTKRVQDGNLSGVFKAPNGFHILKVIERRGIINESKREVVVQPPKPKPVTIVDPRVTAARQDGPVDVQETHVRHILVRETPVFTSEQAHQKIEQIRQRINNGMSFDEAASRYSDDTSGPIGGDIGWVAPGQSDPNFEKAMNSLQEDQLSQAVKTNFGWHLIEVLGRRTEDKKEDVRRDLARESIFTERADAVLEDWISQLRSRAYIDNRLTGEITSRNSVGE